MCLCFCAAAASALRLAACVSGMEPGSAVTVDKGLQQTSTLQIRLAVADTKYHGKGVCVLQNIVIAGAQQYLQRLGLF